MFPTKARIDLLLRACIAMLVLAALLASFGRYHWRLDLLAHWRWHYVGAAAVLATVLVARRRYGYAALGMATVALNAGVLLHPAANASAPAVEHDPARHLRLANVNVLYSNAGHDRLLAWLRSARPDVAVIVEPTSAWAGSLGALKSDLPHALVVAKPKGDGIALYSRFPLQRSEVLYLGENRRAALVAELAVGGRPLTLVAAHPLPPRNARSTRDRDAYLRGVASILGPADGPAILAGDLNTTPWSYSFQDLVRASGLAPGPVPATWPSILGPLGIPIDHVLARGVAIETLETGPHIGSDHLPVLARLTF